VGRLSPVVRDATRASRRADRARDHATLEDGPADVQRLPALGHAPYDGRLGEGPVAALLPLTGVPEVLWKMLSEGEMR
jgi:hypothetical protein